MRYSTKKICTITFTTLILLSVLKASFAAGAGSLSDRGERWQFYLGGNYVNSSSIDFGGGSKADIVGDMGWAFGFGYNFNEKLALDFDLGWNSMSYTGTRVLDNGSKDTFGGRMDTSSTRFNLIYHFMDKQLTPYITGNIGWTWIDTNIPAGPPGSVCWWDPWWGWICGPYQPTYGSTEFSYGTSLGLRYDAGRAFFFRGSIGKQWIDISSASGTPDFTSYRFEFGWLF
ncbi:outer membrane beta-barrel protein [Kaarinaea lacus]